MNINSEISRSEGVKEPFVWCNLCHKHWKYHITEILHVVDQSIKMLSRGSIFLIVLTWSFTDCSYLFLNVLPKLFLFPSATESCLNLGRIETQVTVSMQIIFKGLLGSHPFQSSMRARKCQGSPPRSSSLWLPCWAGYSSCHLVDMQTFTWLNFQSWPNFFL